MTQAPGNSYQDLQQQIAVLQLETERKFNRLLNESITTNDRLDRLAATVERLAIEAAAARAEFRISIERLATEAAVDRAERVAEAASDRIEFREEVIRIWQYLLDRHAGNGSGS